MRQALLLVTVAGRLCGLPVEHVRETMRPLPLETLSHAPRFVAGVSIVRGEPTPVVDLALLFDDGKASKPTRLVTLRLNESRCVGVLVERVLRVHYLEHEESATLPRLLDAAATELVQKLSELDGELLWVLQAGPHLPDSVWNALASHEVAP